MNEARLNEDFMYYIVVIRVTVKSGNILYSLC